MTQVMTKQVMLYHLNVEYEIGSNKENLPIFTMTFAVNDSEGFAEFVHNSMLKLAELTIEASDEVTQ